MPLLVVLGVAAVVGYMAADQAHIEAQHAACGDLPAVSIPMYAAAYGALLCGVLAYAVLLWLLLTRLPVFARWQGHLAAVSAGVGVLPLLFECYLVYSLYQPQPGGVISCAG